MFFTCQEILTRARAVLNDEIADYRWDDPRAIRYAADGLRELYTRKPSCGYTDGDIVTTAPADPTAATDTIRVDRRFLVAISDYVVSRCLSEDSEDANNQKKAGEYFNRFVQGIA